MSWLKKDGNISTSSRDDGTGNPITDVSDKNILNWLSSNVNQASIEGKLDAILSKMDILISALSGNPPAPSPSQSDLILSDGNLYYTSPITNTDLDNLYIDEAGNLFFTDVPSNSNAYLTESNGNVYATMA